jgi:hypothetical protein
MIIQLQFSEIMGCANLFQRFLTLAVYCVSTPSILLTRVHVTTLNWKYALKRTNHTCVYETSFVQKLGHVYACQ